MRRNSASKRKNWVMTVLFVGGWIFGAALYRYTSDVSPWAHKPIPTMTTTSALDVETLAPCPGEAGPVAQTPRIPCVWDGTIAGDTVYGAGIRWLVYLPTCPEVLPTVQNRAMVRCISWEDWGE